MSDVSDLRSEVCDEGDRGFRGSVIDLFCGAGGLSHGFLCEGFHVAAGYDVDETCRHAFEQNNKAPFVPKSVEVISGADLAEKWSDGLPRILAGCAPCQPFSKYTQGRKDDRWMLLNEFSRLIEEARPDIVSMENVPRLTAFEGGSVFNQFVRRLRNDGYFVDWTVAFCPDYGVPQSRSRLVLLASRFGPPGVPEPTHTPDKYLTVKDAIGGLARIGAGSVDKSDHLHRSSRLSERNMERILRSKPGGTWRDWDKELVTPCHQKATGRGYASVYGRMSWDEPAPTMTTQFFGFGNGRFGHPEQDRAISLREGALLQSFPSGYEFVAPGQKVQMKSVGRMIGNAVPVALASAVARRIEKHLKDYGV